MTVKDDVVAVSKDTLDLAASIRMIRHDPGNELLHAVHAVFDQRIVLAIGGAGVKPEGIFDPASDHSFVEVNGDVFVGLGHGLSPRLEHRVGIGGGLRDPPVTPSAQLPFEMCERDIGVYTLIFKCRNKLNSVPRYTSLGSEPAAC